MRISISATVAILATIAFFSLSATNAVAGQRHQEQVLQNDYLTPPGHGVREARVREVGYKSRRRGFRSSRWVWQKERHRSGHGVSSRRRQLQTHSHQHHNTQSVAKYRNRTQFCRRNWERHHGHKVVVRRCVWVHNSKLRRSEGH